jgi:hypothetical protein
MNVDIYDIDGNGADKSARQYVEVNNLEAFAISSGTLLDVTQTQDGEGVRFSANNTPSVEGNPEFMAPGFNITGLPGTVVTTQGPEEGFLTGDLVRAQLLYDRGISSFQFKLGESGWAESINYRAFFALNFGSSIPFENTQTFGFSSLGDRVWADTNVNGQQDDGEAGVAGVEVELFASVNGQPSGTVLASTSTDNKGNYNFQDLPPGDYIVKFAAPEVARFTLANQGDDASDSDANASGFTASYTLAPGESNNTVDAGLISLSSITGNVYHDVNNDGVFDPGEPGIGGVALTLTGVDAFGNAVSLSTTTAANGSYQFADLLPGNYSVTQTQPEEWNDGKDALGSAGGDLANDLLSDITLLSGTSASGYNFGEVLPPPLDPIVAPGVRTPGFWGSSTWSSFWDGVAGNEPKQVQTKGFPVGDLLFAPYKTGAQGTQRDPVTGTNKAGLLIGDWNRNGITDATEQTIFYTTSEALKIINASVKPSTDDTRYILGRSLNAAWLNYVAGNPVDTAAVGDRDARYWINAGIQWLGTHTPDENGNLFGDGSLTSLASPAIKASSAAWDTPHTGGNTIHNRLDRYNNGEATFADGLFSGG